MRVHATWARLLDPIRDAVLALAEDHEAGQADRDTDNVRRLRWPWQWHRQTAA